MIDDKKKSLEILDAIYDEAARLEAKEGKSTPEVRAWADGVRDDIQARLAELRRSLVPTAPAPESARPIRPSTLAMTRDMLLARLDEWAARLGGKLQIAHRHLSGLSDDDLRRLLDTIEEEEG